MFRRVLVANRGEIAVRIIYALKELGIESVAIYSEADEDALHVQLADYAIRIGPASLKESYLSIPRIMSAASLAGVDAIHPGYGFLAENPVFAEICEESGIKFIGPTSKIINLMGNKIEAKRIMKEAGVPVLPGNDSPVNTLEEVVNVAKEVGFPIILKAALGGGGRGMRIVRDPLELPRAYDMAKRESELAFGDGSIYIEKYIEKPRHIEVQIVGDEHGNIVHLGERECSIQRRHQKLLEEAPSPAVDPSLREEMGEAALRGARALGYNSVGTMEFLLDQDGNFYFMEMNTRIQVEHPVTEMVTGVDLVKVQILVAEGETLPIKGAEIAGHSIEVRINAEDPERGFIPSPGKIKFVHFPGGPGVRVDSHIYSGYRIPPQYDSLIAKLIVHGRNREEALARLKRALDEFIVEGVPTTIPLFKKIVGNPEFQKGNTHTHFLEEI